MKTMMLEELACSVAIVRSAEEVIPRWRIATPEGEFVVFTRFADDDDQRAYALWFISRFMIWKMALGFVMTGETWLTADRGATAAEAVVTIGVPRDEASGALCQITRQPFLSVGELEWLSEAQIDPAYRRLLPANEMQLTTDELATIVAAFGEGGDFPARRLS